MKNISKINLKGNYFKDKHSLDIYGTNRDEKDYKAVIIYGKNGSGKSSVCDLFYKFSKKKLSEYEEFFECLDVESNEIKFDDKDFSNMHVYDSNFINDNMDFKQEGLNTIVTFGIQKEIDDELSKLKIEKEELTNKNRKTEKELEKTTIKNDLTNPNTYLESVKKTLTNDGGWADREGKEINKKSKKASVSDDFVISLINESINYNIEQNIYNEYKEKQLIFKNIDADAEVVDLGEINKIEYEHAELEKNADLLGLEFKQTGLSDTEQKILELIKNYSKQDFYLEVKRNFSDELVNECPYCFQGINKEQKKKLVENIDNILNDEIKIFKQKTNDFKRVLENYNSLINSNNDFLIKHISIIEELYSEFTNSLKLYEKEYKTALNEIDSKVDNPYLNIDYKISVLITKYDIINEILRKVCDNFEKYNENIRDVKTLKSELIILNKKKALNEIKSDSEKYIKSHRTVQNLSFEINKMKSKILEIERKETELSMQKKNVGIALEQINSWIRYICMDSSKLELEYVDSISQYVIKSNKEVVKLKKLSTGEKNIISLCYFFSLLMENKTTDSAFIDDLLIVIDDPISSFDYENKVGVYSFLRMIFSKIIKSNDKSKIFVFTHSIEVGYFLYKTFSDFLPNKQIITKTLIEKGLVDYNIEKTSQYSDLLNEIYDFVNDPEIENPKNIGNSIRKVLEAFGTFNYKVGIEKLSTDPLIIEKIPLDKREIFENLMYRLVLHGDSHLEQETKNYVEQDLFYSVSSSERIKIAKKVLIFLYFLDSAHLKKHFKDNSKAITDIDNWSKEI